MGLKITAKCLPKYFERLKDLGEDYRQFDEIIFVNTETGEEKTFGIDEISLLENSKMVRNLTPEILWDEEHNIHVIKLGLEKKKKGGKKCSAKKN